MDPHSSSGILSRVPEKIRDKIRTPAEAAGIIEKEMLVAVGGYTSAGYPKVVLKELVKLHADNDFQISVLSGANVGPIDALLCEQNMIRRRIPMIESRELARDVNQGEVHYIEQQMNRMPWRIVSGDYGEIDLAIVEALRVTDEGIVPTSSIGMLPTILKKAKQIIVEINLEQPLLLEELHDIHDPGTEIGRAPIPLSDLQQRIGSACIAVDSEKIVAVVQSEVQEKAKYVFQENVQLEKIANNLLSFLSETYEREQMPPLQTGFGNLTNQIAVSLEKSRFSDLRFFCGGVSQAILELVPSGKVRSITTSSVQMTNRTRELLDQHADLFREKMIVRNGELTNSSELISRFAPISINTGIEIDIYGNVNSSHINGSRVMNGIGGGANFAENAGLSVIVLPAIAKNGAISTIVPMVSHVDITEHNVDVIITEHGIADLRGCDELERAHRIIDNCSDPEYRELLTEYLNEAVKYNPGHHPVDLRNALSWHIRLLETGSMKDV